METDTNPDYCKGGHFDADTTIRRAKEKTAKKRAISESYRTSKSRNLYTVPFDSPFKDLPYKEKEKLMIEQGFVKVGSRWRRSA